MVPSSCAATCMQWAMLEQFPASAYIDTHQIHRLASFNALGGATGALALEEVDVEATSDQSSPINALVHGSLVPSTMEMDGRAPLESAIPFHLRYGPPSANSSRQSVHIPPPRLFLCCADNIARRDIDRAQAQCAWRRVPRVDARTLETTVPIGYSGHLYMVVFTTVAALLLGAALLMTTLWSATGPRQASSPSAPEPASYLRLTRQLSGRAQRVREDLTRRLRSAQWRYAATRVTEVNAVRQVKSTLAAEGRLLGK